MGKLTSLASFIFQMLEILAISWNSLPYVRIPKIAKTSIKSLFITVIGPMAVKAVIIAQTSAIKTLLDPR